MKFVVNQRIEVVERSLIPITPLGEKLRYLVFLSGRVFLHKERNKNLGDELFDLARFAKHLVDFADVQFLL